MKRFEIETTTLKAMVEEDLKAAEGFEKHIRNAILESTRLTRAPWQEPKRAQARRGSQAPKSNQGGITL